MRHAAGRAGRRDVALRAPGALVAVAVAAHRLHHAPVPPEVCMPFLPTPRWTARSCSDLLPPLPLPLPARLQWGPACRTAGSPLSATRARGSSSRSALTACACTPAALAPLSPLTHLPPPHPPPLGLPCTGPLERALARRPARGGHGAARRCRPERARRAPHLSLAPRDGRR